MPDLTPTEQFEEWRDNLPHATQLIAVNRACGDVGYERELMENGGLRIDGDLDDQDFLDALHQRFLQMYVQEAFAELVEDGEIVASGIDPETGEIQYTLA